MMQKLPPITSERSIYRVSNRLRINNPVAYTPQAISIGPFHHGKEDLKAMEQLKLQFLDSYLCRINMGVEAAIEIAQKWESRARDYYAEPINMESDDFVKMMLVDGCFIVEFMIIRHGGAIPQTKNGELSPSFYEAIAVDLSRDLIMLENQLPFLILEDLYTKLSLSTSFVQVAVQFLTRWFMGRPFGLPDPTAFTTKLNHLVDLFSFYYAIPLDNDRVTSKSDQSYKHPTATELSLADVKFQKTEKDKHIMDISFHDQVLKIPPFEISDEFETSLRNLMAFEHYHSGSNKRYAIQYAIFMNELINTEKDVSLLVEAKIITNMIIGGSHEEILNFFNHLCKDITIDFDFYCYDQINRALHEHCNTARNKWLACLRRDYFNSPWALITFYTFLLTALQFVFTVLPVSE